MATTAPALFTDPTLSVPERSGYVRQRKAGAKNITSLQLGLAERQALDELARENGVSKSAVLRQGLRLVDAISPHQARLAALATQLQVSEAEVLHLALVRLAEDEQPPPDPEETESPV